ncbi:hypothetical protein AB0C81_21205 [Streptomyces roseoverticillatus]|uniref:hypothetical protein n=1 Tax=Streptomyces roseoverticillatus TaxID=66429 RepID=UPI0033D1FA09
MADDHRYDWLEDWLDDDAVERLLSGSPAAGPAQDSAAADEDMTAGTAGDAPTNEDGREGPAAGGASGDGSAAGGRTGAAAGDGSGVSPEGRAAGPAPGGAPVPAEAERLVTALRALVPPPAVDGVPLPGEDAALAAFREARAATATSAAANSATVAETASAKAAAATSATVAAAAPVAPVPAPAPASAPEPSVRLGVLAAPRRRFFSRLQPVKAALAMALAGCAIGGVAVAAGAGVLPAPFGRSGGEPAAAPSVSAFGDAPAGDVTPDGRRVPGASPSRGRDGSPSGSGTPDGSGSSAPGAGRSRTPGDRNEPADSPSASPRPGKSKDDGGRGDAAKPGTAWALRMCRDYLDAQKHRGNAVDEDDVRTLERAAGIGSAVDLRAFCERLVKADDAAGSGTATGAGGLTGGGTGSGKSGDGSGGDGGNGGPNGVFRLVPPVRSSTGFGAPAPGVTFSDPAAL